MSETVLVTGISGFIAKQVALDLLNRRFNVRGTVRSQSRAHEVRNTLENHEADVSRLSFAHANLDEDRGWVDAVRGCDYVQHVASPVPIVLPRDREGLVPQARTGTLRVLEAARVADVKHIVVTSSVAAMAYRDKRSPDMTISENDWSDPEWSKAHAYIVAKTRAELAVWAWAQEHGWTSRVTTVNPSYVLGPLLDDRVPSSAKIVELLLNGANPFIMPHNPMLVDVRDVAELHVRAMTIPQAGGRRLLAAAETVSMQEVADILRHAFPSYASMIPKRTMPHILVPLLAPFNPPLRFIAPDINARAMPDSTYVTDLTGITFLTAAEAVRSMGQSLIDFGVV